MCRSLGGTRVRSPAGRAAGDDMAAREAGIAVVRGVRRSAGRSVTFEATYDTGIRHGPM